MISLSSLDPPHSRPRRQMHLEKFIKGLENLNHRVAHLVAVWLWKRMPTATAQVVTGASSGRQPEVAHTWAEGQGSRSGERAGPAKPTNRRGVSLGTPFSRVALPLSRTHASRTHAPSFPLHLLLRSISSAALSALNPPGPRGGRRRTRCTSCWTSGAGSAAPGSTTATSACAGKSYPSPTTAPSFKKR